MTDTERKTGPVASMVAKGFARYLNRITPTPDDAEKKVGRFAGLVGDVLESADVQESGADLVDRELQRVTGEMRREIFGKAGKIVEDKAHELNPANISAYSLIRGGLANENDGVFRKVGKTVIAAALNVGVGISSLIAAKSYNHIVEPENPIEWRALHNLSAVTVNRLLGGLRHPREAIWERLGAVTSHLTPSAAA